MKLTNSNREVTPQDIDNYLAEKLSSSDKHFIEAKALEDPFLADAIDGFKDFPNELSNIPSFKSKNHWVWILSSIFVLLIFGVLILNPLSNESELTIAQEVTKNHELIPFKKDAIKTENTVHDVVKKELNHKIITKPLTNQKDVKKEEQILPLVREVVNLETYHHKPEIFSQETNYNLAEVKIKTISYYNFIAVDYSVIYINKIDFEEVDMGTPANQSDVTSYRLTDEMKLSKTHKFTYKEYLKKSLEKLSRQKYSSALSHFETILDHYPQDVNAQFYSGFSLFNMGKFEKSLKYFDKAIHNSFDFFYEDAQWYKALTLEELGKYQEAKLLFKKIYKERGFYANQAFKKI